MSTPHRSPSAIAADIRADIYRAGGFRGSLAYAKPYLDTCEQLASWKDSFGHESGQEIGLRLLSNLGTWRGAKAREIKAEIKAALGIK